MNFPGAEEYIVGRLRNELPATLIYHTLEHTLDTLKMVKQWNVLERIDPQTGLITETAALFHDAGMLVTYKEHEIASTEIARNSLPLFDYSQTEIDEICDLIMVTCLPQRPVDHNGQILCDADMDNLGRDDFFIQSFRLKLELEMNGIATLTVKEWLESLVHLLEDHAFFTPAAISVRQRQKDKNLSELKEIVKLF
jgi:uncharacterized protein